MGKLLVLLILVAVIGGVVFYLRTRSKKPAVPSDKAAPARTAWPEESISEKMNQRFSGLTDLLLNMRIEDVDDEVFQIVSNTIEELMRVLPKATSKYPGSEMTWVAGRIADDYLPALVNPYVGLSEEGRKEKKAALSSALGDISVKLSEIDRSIDTGDAVNFETQVNYLKSILSKASIEAV